MINKSYFIEGPQLSPQSVMMGKSCLKQRQKEEMLRLVDNCKYCYEDNLITKEVPDHAGWRKRICNCSWICCSKGNYIKKKWKPIVDVLWKFHNFNCNLGGKPTLKSGEDVSLPEEDSGQLSEATTVREETEVYCFKIIAIIEIQLTNQGCSWCPWLEEEDLQLFLELLC